MKSKKLIITIIAALLIVAVSIPVIRGTMAYFTDKADGTNTFIIGNVDIDIEEDFDPPSDPKPGENIFKKDVKLKNNGKNTAYGRVWFDFSNTDIADVSEISPDGKEFYSLDEFKNHLPEGWVFVEDGEMGGYFYYTKPLKPGDLSTSLFVKVKTTFDDYDGNTDRRMNYTVRDYNIYVLTEGIQARRLNGEVANGSGLASVTDAAEFDDIATIPYDEAWTTFLSRKEAVNNENSQNNEEPDNNEAQENNEAGE